MVVLGASGRMQLPHRRAQPSNAGRASPRGALRPAPGHVAARSCSRLSVRYHFRVEPRLKLRVMMMMMLLNRRPLLHVPLTTLHAESMLYGAQSAWACQGDCTRRLA